MGSHCLMTRISTSFAVLLLQLVVYGLPASAAETEPYRIQPGDVLQISVWREQELQQDVLVRPDGGVNFPLAGELQAAEGTIEALRSAIHERLGKFIPDPVVTVAVKGTLGSRIYIVGKVNRPGDFALGRPTDVMQALALAGGATPFADVNDIRILRREGDQQVSLSFKYDEVAKGRRLDQNVLLKSGDTVVVP
jgi:polysaccharide biosynthesis/export protein